MAEVLGARLPARPRLRSGPAELRPDRLLSGPNNPVLERDREHGYDDAYRESDVESGGAEQVGRSTTRAVVVSIFLVILVDLVFTTLFFFLGGR